MTSAAVRVNEIKLAAASDHGFAVWRKAAAAYAQRNRLREVYFTRFGRIMDVTCSSVLSADQLLTHLIDQGIPEHCIHVVGGKDNVAK